MLVVELGDGRSDPDKPRRAVKQQHVNDRRHLATLSSALLHSIRSVTSLSVFVIASATVDTIECWLKSHFLSQLATRCVRTGEILMKHWLCVYR